MIAAPFHKIICFDECSATPKYRQLANAIVKAIEDGKLQADDMLPSINDLSVEFAICRDTAERGYKQLKAQGIIASVPGKGYYVRTTDLKQRTKILLLFNKLSPHKKIIYDSLAQTLGEGAAIDFYIYNNDLSLFRRLLENARSDYHFYAVLPHFIEGGEAAHRILNQLPTEKLILLDNVLPGVTGTFGAVYENFGRDIFGALEEALPHLRKYRTLKLIFPRPSHYPCEIAKGFTAFCGQYGFAHGLVPDIGAEPIAAGDLFINLTDEDLVVLVERLVESAFVVGTDVGVISYNETPLKKIILNGIATVSTDFEAMGAETGRMILENRLRQVAVPFRLTWRPSL